MEKTFIPEQVGDMVTNDWKIKNREFCNIILLDFIKLYYVLNGSDLRFIQMIWASYIIDKEDRFYEEPYDTIKRILPNIVNKLRDSNINNRLPAKILRNNIIRNLKSIDINVFNNDNN